VGKKEITGKGQKFLSADAIRYNIWKYAIAHQFEYKLDRNAKQRIMVKCKTKWCDFYIHMCKRATESRGDDSQGL